MENLQLNQVDLNLDDIIENETAILEDQETNNHNQASLFEDVEVSLNFLKGVKNIEMIFKDVLPSNQISLFYAPSNQGKTTAVLAMLNTILTTNKDIKINYFDFDNGVNTMKDKITKIKEKNENFSYVPYQEITFIEVLKRLDKLAQDKANLENLLFVFDSLQHFVPNDLSSAKSEKDLKELFTLFKNLRNQGATIIIISHTTKEKDQEGRETTFRGLNIIKDNLDNMFLLNRVYDENNYILKNEKTRHIQIKDFIKLHFDLESLTITKTEPLSREDYEFAKVLEEDKEFIEMTIRTLDLVNAYKDYNSICQKDLINAIYQIDDNELSQYLIKKKLRKYAGRFWIIKKGNNGNINNYMLENKPDNIKKKDKTFWDTCGFVNYLKEQMP